LGRWWPKTDGNVIPNDDDPRRIFATPYRNVRPEVEYVGDEACATCHAEHMARYRRHPMGRALAPVTESETIEHFGPEAHNPFQALNATFQVLQRGGETIHRQVNRDEQGNEIA